MYTIILYKESDVMFIHHMVSRIPNPEFDVIKHEYKKIPILSKTSEFPIESFEIQYHLGSAKTFWTCIIQEVKFSSEKLFLDQSKKFWHSQNEIGFPKYQLGIQKFGP